MKYAKLAKAQLSRRKKESYKLLKLETKGGGCMFYNHLRMTPAVNHPDFPNISGCARAQSTERETWPLLVRL